MGKSLVIVESPAKVKKIQGFLGSSYIVKSSFGHCYQIDPKGISIDIEDNFNPKYIIAQKKSKVVKELKDAAKMCDTVYIASDPDREGEAIGWHIAKFIIKDDSKIKRVTFHEITKSAVLKAFKSATTLDEPMYYSQQARAVIDRLVGYTVSPVLWKKVCKGTSAGRVQSIGLKLIVGRQKEIDAFVPKEYWSVDGIFKTAGGEDFNASYFKSGKVPDKSTVDDILKEIKSVESWNVDSINRSKKNKHPSPVFTTSSLQQFASNNFGWPGKKTMSVAQSVYEAGLCVLPDELVIKPNGEILSAKEAVDESEPQLIGFSRLTKDSNLNTGVTSVYDHQKIRYEGNIKRIRTLDGQELGVTPDHEILSWNQMYIDYKKSSNLKIGDFVLCSKNIRDIERSWDPGHIYYLIVECLKEEHHNKILVGINNPSLVSEILEGNRKSLKSPTYCKYKKNNRIPFKLLKSYLHNAHLSDQEELDLIKTVVDYFLWATPGSKPEMFSVEDFLYFLGICLGDGHIPKESKGICMPRCIADSEVWDDLYSRFMRCKAGERDIVTFSGQILKKLCIEVGGREGPKSEYIYLHRLVSKVKRELLLHFIAGLFDTDGCVNFKHNLQVSYSTVSEKFAKQLNLLFRSLGYFSGIFRRNDDEKNCTVRIRRKDSLKLIKELLPYLRMIKGHCEENLPKVSVGESQNTNLPVANLIESVRKKAGITKEKLSVDIFGDSSSYWNYLKKKPGRTRPSYFNPELLNKIADYLNDSRLKMIANGDAYFSEVTSIVDEYYNGYVYDVSTGTENFLCNTFYVHNCTYHRTDSVNVSKEAINDVRAYISASYGSSYLPPKPNYYKTKNKSAQEAHEGIRCTSVQDTPNKVAHQLTPDQKKLYEAIYNKFVSSQMSDAELDSMKVVISSDDGKHKFNSSGQRIIFDGFLKVWSHSSTKDSFLPDMSEKDPSYLKEVNAEQHFTKPPPSFNDASLVKTLEEEGVGRPSTYASIIETLINRTYVERDNKTFKPTELGVLVCDYLSANFTELMDTGYTARVEEKLDDISKGSYIWYDVVKDFYSELEKRISVANKNKGMKEAKKTGITCPTCNKFELVIRRSKYGEFYGCSGFEEKGKEKCRASFKIGDDGSPVAKKEVEYLPGVKCDKCGKKVAIRTSTKTGNKFGGCSGFPKCKRMFDMEGNPMEFKKKFYKKK